MQQRIRGWKALVHDAVDFTVDMIEEGHESIGRNAMRVLGASEQLVGPAHVVNEIRRSSVALALGSVRGVNRAVQWLTDAGLQSALAPRLVPWLQDPPAEPIVMRSDIIGTPAWLSDAAIGALNGAVGDYLHREGNALDLGFALRFRDGYLDLDAPNTDLPSKVAVFVHGLGATEWSWCYNALEGHGDAAQCFGTLLEKDAGLAPIFARYNSGRRVAENGRLLADALERLFASRVSSALEIVLIGHSMGGLVVQSACHHARMLKHGWVERVSRVFSLGAPHQGAPLEQFGNLATAALGSVDLPGTRIPAAILRRRSAGMRDLRHGTVLDNDAEAELLEHASYTFVSATVTRDSRHPLGWLVGDVLVRVPSASGPASVKTSTRFETACVGGMLHQELQNHPDVYAVLKRACSGAQA